MGRSVNVAAFGEGAAVFMEPFLVVRTGFLAQIRERGALAHAEAALLVLQDNVPDVVGEVDAAGRASGSLKCRVRGTMVTFQLITASPA